MQIKIDLRNVRVREVPVLDENGQPTDQMKQIAQVSFYFPEVIDWPVMVAMVDWPATPDQIQVSVVEVAAKFKSAAEQTLLLTETVKTINIPDVS